ncbi:MAG TPA: amidohydrolase family protein [Acidimicrobiales bacterium]|nr:amidohydrolase family protein [Acidimicrobiales bacterium]
MFSADDHISVAEDIFYERFPTSLKEQAPRVVLDDGAWTLAMGGKTFLPREFNAVLMQYDPLDGATTRDVDARIRELESDGIHKELAFPNAILALLAWPDKEIRGLCFRIYNEYMAELQERSKGRFYGVGLINYWDGDGTRQTLAELKSLGLKTFLLPLKPGKDDEDRPIDYNRPSMEPVWEAIEESGVPVAHHIGEAPLASPCRDNSVLVGMMHNVAPFREMFGRYVFGGILDRHPGLKIGWFEGGINWVPAAIQDGEHLYASMQHMADHGIEHDVAHYWHNHMYASFMVDPLGLEMIDRIGVDRVMWSSDYPHNESTFGYSEQSLASVVDAVGPAAAAKIASTNIESFLGLRD